MGIENGFIMKIKVGFTGIKKDQSGEIYKFKAGKAVIPGFRLQGKPIEITFKEFNELNQGASHVN